MHGGDIYRNRIELDFSVNVNPFGIPTGVKQALHEAVEECHRYPDPLCEKLREGLAECYGITREKIAVGNGASELFPAILQTFKPGRVLMPVPCFSGYEKACAMTGTPIKTWQMKEEDNFCLTEEFIEEIEQWDMVFLAHPNNPTGQMVGEELLEKIVGRIHEKEAILVLDVCFYELTGRSLGTMDYIGESPETKSVSHPCISWKDDPRVILVHAFTKSFAIPGVRLGFCTCGDAAVIEKINEHLPEWNVSYLAQKAGIAALASFDEVKKACEFLESERPVCVEKMMRLGFKVYPSETNYLLFYSSVPLYEPLKEQGILIRDCSDYEGLGEGYYRVAIRTRAENERLWKAIESIV